MVSTTLIGAIRTRWRSEPSWSPSSHTGGGRPTTNATPIQTHGTTNPENPPSTRCTADKSHPQQPVSDRG